MRFFLMALLFSWGGYAQASSAKTYDLCLDLFRLFVKAQKHHEKTVNLELLKSRPERVLALAKKDSIVFQDDTWETIPSGQNVLGKLNLINNHRLKKILTVRGEKPDQINSEAFRHFITQYEEEILELSQRFSLPVDELVSYYLRNSKVHFDVILQQLSEKEVVDSLIKQWKVSPQEFFKRSLAFSKTSLHQVEIYFSEVEDASQVLQIPLEIFLSRLERTKTSIPDFFKMVDNFKYQDSMTRLEKAKKLMTRAVSTISSMPKNGLKGLGKYLGELPKTVLQADNKPLALADYLGGKPYRWGQDRLRHWLRGELIDNPQVAKGLGVTLAIDNFTMISEHFLHVGFERLLLLGSDVFSFLALEIVLTLGSTRNAALLVAKPHLMKKVTERSAKLSVRKKGMIRAGAKQFKRMLLGVSHFSQDVARNVPGLFAKTFAITGVGYAITTPFDAETVELIGNPLAAIFFNAVAASAYISTSSNLRYVLAYGKVFPYVTNKLFLTRPKAAASTVMALTGLNMYLGAKVFVWYKHYLVCMAKERKGEKCDEEEDEELLNQASPFAQTSQSGEPPVLSNLPVSPAF